MKINIGGAKNAQHINTKDWSILDLSKYDGNSQEVDTIVDLNKDKIPHESNTVDAIYTSHTLEHILPHRQSIVFQEMYRILKPKGFIRIVVPDIDFAIDKYTKGIKLDKAEMPTKLECLPNFNICYLSGWFYTYRYPETLLGGHVMAYNRELLYWYLNKYNFKNIEYKSFNKCNEIFKGCDYVRYKDYSLYIEANK